MALYKNPAFVSQSTHNDFDLLHRPGANTPHSAIYRCKGCGKEIVSETNRPFPPQNHHQHTPAQGAIEWQMAVYAVSNP
jgi:hypothetical protein